MQDWIDNQWQNLFLYVPFLMAFGGALYFSLPTEPNLIFAPFISLILILCSIILTAFHQYVKIVKWGGAGALVPITGFANSVAATAIEFKREGIIFGLCVKMFSVAGPVIVNGTVISIIVGFIYLFL